MTRNRGLRKKLKPFQFRPITIRWFHNLFPLLVIGLAVHLLLPQLANLEQAWQTVSQMPEGIVALAFIAQIVSYIGSGYLLQSLTVLVQERLSILFGIAITLAGNSMGLVTGGIVGNGAAIYHWLAARNISKEAAGLCSTMPSLFNNILLMLIAIAGLLHLLVIHQLPRLQAIGFGVILGVLIFLLVGGIWGVNHPEKLLAVVTPFAKRWARLWKRPYSSAGTENDVNQLVNIWIVLGHGGWLHPLVGTILSIAFDMMTLFFLFVATGHSVSLGILLTGYGLPLIVGKVGFLPGGVGIVETTMTAIYVSLGVPSHIAVVVILVYRLISFWIPTLMGFPLVLYFQQMTRNRIRT